MYVVACYVIFLVISAVAVIAVGQVLRKSGLDLLNSQLNCHHDLASKVIRLTLVGFYLINLGFVCLLSQGWYPITDLRPVVESLIEKIGGILIFQGVTVCFALHVISRYWRRTEQA